jgi:hypothetical protein
MLTSDDIGVPSVNVLAPIHIVPVRRIGQARVKRELQVIVCVDETRHQEVSREVDSLRSM